MENPWYNWFNRNQIRIGDIPTKGLQRNIQPLQLEVQFALVVLIAKQATLKKKHKNRHEYDQVLLADKLRIAKLILKKELNPEKQQVLMNFLFSYVNFEFQETKSKFDQQMILLTDKNINEMTINEILIGQAELRGERKGIKRGEKLAKEKMITRLIEKLHLTDAQIVELTIAPVSLVKRIRKKTAMLN